VFLKEAEPETRAFNRVRTNNDNHNKNIITTKDGALYLLKEVVILFIVHRTCHGILPDLNFLENKHPSIECRHH